MSSTFITWFVVALVLVTSVGLLISRDWRWNLGLMAAQYFGVFILISQTWPFGLASVKLVTGWMACAALGVTRLGLPEGESPLESAWPQGRAFRLFAASIVIALVLASAPNMEALVPGINAGVVRAGLFLAGMGLLHLGITAEPLRVALGLLTFLAGFEVLYASIETSVLLAGLFAIVNLGLALVGSYWMSAAQPAESAQ